MQQWLEYLEMSDDVHGRAIVIEARQECRSIVIGSGGLAQQVIRGIGKVFKHIRSMADSTDDIGEGPQSSLFLGELGLVIEALQGFEVAEGDSCMKTVSTVDQTE